MSPFRPGGLEELVDDLGAGLGAAMEQIAFPLYVVDGDGMIRWLNDAAVEIVGDMVGTRFVDLLAPETADKARREFAAKLLGTRRRSDYELVVVDREGRRLRIEISAVPLLDDGRVVGILGVGYLLGPAIVRGDSSLAQLTPRQREVLDLLADGKSTREMADELALSQETVRNHVRHLLRRLGARSRLEAALEARRLGGQG